MLIPLLISYGVWLFVLICLTRSNSHQWRFWVKVLTCAHFAFLGVWAVVRFGLHDNELLLLLGLGSSFLGDLALGLKDKSKWMFGAGVLFFMTAMLCYCLFFGFSEVSLWLSIPVFLGLGLIFLNISQSKSYDFKGSGPLVLIYGVLLSTMAVTALSKGLLEPSSASLSRTLGAIMLVLSDVILMHVYFYTPKKARHIIEYLLLYHAGQCLIALSLWLN
jgi:uncharacterized membrane protein YhhN